MSTFVPPGLDVAAAGRRWEVGEFVLWESSRAGVVLFVPRRPRLAVDAAQGRFQAAVSVYRLPGAAQSSAPGPGHAGSADGSFAELRITGGGTPPGPTHAELTEAGQEALAGALGFTVTAGAGGDPADRAAVVRNSHRPDGVAAHTPSALPGTRSADLEAQWREALARSGYPDARRARFAPLPSRHARVRCDVDPRFGLVEGGAAGAGEGGAAERELGDLQGLVFLLLRLTDLGARQVLAALKQGAELPAPAGVVRVTYEYPVFWRQASAAGELRSEGIGWLGASTAVDLATLLAPLDASYLAEVNPRVRPTR